MSKSIKVTPEELLQIRNDFEKMLREVKISDGKINFTKELGHIQRRATLYFTELAWLKQSSLVREFDDEVAWHGIAKRGKNPDTYIIEDILVYPQEVTGATVTTDQKEYQTWLMNMEDEVFENIRMQGHSHVEMDVKPSSVDTSLYDRILEQLDDDMFYIFLIWNKRNDKTIKIYDLRENVLFDTSDITVKVLETADGLCSFMKNAKQRVKRRETTYINYPTTKRGEVTKEPMKYTWRDFLEKPIL